MSGSTLNPPEESRQVTGTGHTTGALGPSDSSDSGSDIRGASKRPGDMEEALDAHALEGGDAALESDTDRYGTGERASADGDGGLMLDGDVVPRGTEYLEDMAETEGGVSADPREDADDPTGGDAAPSRPTSAKLRGPRAAFDDDAVHEAMKHASPKHVKTGVKTK